MPIISVFSSIFCSEEMIVKELLEGTGYAHRRDGDVVEEAGKISGMHASKVERVFASRISVFNKFTHERERAMAHLKLAMARMLSEDRLLVEGFCTHLIPREVSHVLRVCLIADMKSRVSTGAKEHGATEHEAARIIRRQDEDRAAWVYSLSSLKDPWDASLYDMLIPTDKTRPDEIVGLVQENLEREAVRATGRSRQAVEDFLLSANVEVALVKEGHNVGVKAKNGDVDLTINKHVLMLGRLEEELKSIASRVQGVKTVKVEVGPEFHKADIYRRYDFQMPSKVLLVDDEREFVQTLSERLLMRDMGSAVAYDGESALELIREDEPEVMILDLRMPGIDGIEVLKRVKQTNPDIEVIILTGHGSEADRELCMKLGAFAYLQKPVDIEELSATIKKANEKIHGKE